jgi:hypothetical protein
MASSAMNTLMMTVLWTTAERLTILYIGDFDPSGLDIERAAQARLTNFLVKFGWDSDKIDRLITWKRIGVTLDDYQIIAEKARVSLKEDVDGKRGDPRTPAFKALFDDYGVEVEALEVAEIGGLAQRLQWSIREHIDTDAWYEAKRIESEEVEGLAA